MEQRLQKLLSSAGICSRRDAEKLIAEGRVAVNGLPAALGCRADPELDAVALDGTALDLSPAGGAVYIMLHKPRGYVTTARDDRGRPTVMDLVGDCGGRVYPVGRLDLDSEGLLLLTGDGSLCHALSHPSHQIEKEYHVTVSGAAAHCRERLQALNALEDGTPIAPARVRIVERDPGSLTLSVTIHQGLNRQVRRMCAMAGLKVHRLVRVREGPLTLGNLPAGQWRRLTGRELSALKNIQKEGGRA